MFCIFLSPYLIIVLLSGLQLSFQDLNNLPNINIHEQEY